MKLKHSYKLQKVLTKLTGITLLILILFNALGFWYLFNAQRQHIRHDIKQCIKMGVPKDELFSFTDDLHNPSEEYMWENHKEFWFQNKLYDVISKEQQGSKIIYYCINDMQEEKLFEKLDEFVKSIVSGTDKHAKNNKILVKNSIKDYCFQTFQVSFNSQSRKITYLKHCDLLISLSIEHPTPPPRS